MAEYGLGDSEVYLQWIREFAQRSIEREGRFLDLDLILADFVQDPVPHQPLVRFDAEIISAIQVRHQKTTDAQGAAADIQNTMVLAQAGTCQQVEYHCRDQVVVFGRPYIRPVMLVTRFEAYAGTCGVRLVNLVLHI